MLFREKRREKRYISDLTCTVLSTSERFNVHDVSMHGFSVIGHIHLKCGDCVSVQVDIIDIGYVNIDAIVRNETKVRGINRYGLEIIKIPDSWVNFVYRLMEKDKEVYYGL